MKKFYNESLKESCFYKKLDSGLSVYVCEKKDFTSCHAMLGTAYGSVNNKFCLEGEEMTEVPCGIAHFLEHKLFESETTDAYSLFSKTGAYANAFTSFDRTVYLFSCTNNFNENLSILMNFVSNPFFSEQTVNKEQGIIGQEIEMYLDDPSWRVYFNTLCAMYESNPVKEDVVGSVESISKITPQLLYKCYNTFYRPSNMFLCVAGNVDANEVISAAEKVFASTDQRKIINAPVALENGVKQKNITQSLSVTLPLFCVGIKFCKPFGTDAKSVAGCIVAAEALFGKTSKIYKKLFSLGLVNASFGSEYLFGKNYSCFLINGESCDIKRVEEIFREYINDIKQIFTEDDFIRAKKRVIGKNLTDFNDMSGIASSLVDAAIYFEDPFSFYDALGSISLQDFENVINLIDENNTVFSSVVPK